MGHPFLSRQELQNEANLFLGQLITVVQSNSTSSITVLTSILNILFFIAKERTQYIPVLVPLYVQYATMQTAGMNLMDSRCLQKTIKNILICLLRLNETASFHSMISDTLIELGAKQYEINAANKKRIDGVFSAKKQGSKKRGRDGEEAAKKLIVAEEKVDLSDYVLTTLDVTRFNLNLVVDAVLSTLLMCDQRKWNDTIQVRRNLLF